MPATIEELITAPPGGVRLAISEQNDPIVQALAGTDNPLTRRLAFDRYFALTARNAHPIIPTKVLASFEDGLGSPAIVEHPLGGGRVLLVATSGDREWNNWPQDPSYVIFCLEAARALARLQQAPLSWPPGSGVPFFPLRIGIQPDEDPERATLYKITAADATPIELTIEAGDQTGLAGLRLPAFTETGTYQLTIPRHSGPDRKRLIAVNLDPEESDLAVADLQQLRQALAPLEFEYLTSLDELEMLSQAGRGELWPGLLIAVLAVLMTEQFLAFWFGKRA